jgi:antitoxin YefM
MKTATVSDFRDNVKEYLDQVADNHEELIISRPKNKNIVILSLDDYESLKETTYLLSSSANAARLQEGLAQYKKGKVVKKNLKEL